MLVVTNLTASKHAIRVKPREQISGGGARGKLAGRQEYADVCPVTWVDETQTGVGVLTPALADVAANIEAGPIVNCGNWRWRLGVAALGQVCGRCCIDAKRRANGNDGNDQS